MIYIIITIADMNIFCLSKSMIEVSRDQRKYQKSIIWYFVSYV